MMSGVLTEPKVVCTTGDEEEGREQSVMALTVHIIWWWGVAMSEKP